MRARHVLDPVIDLVFPPRCPVCGDAIAAQTGICAACWMDMVMPGEPACASCSRPLSEVAFGQGVQCGPCLAKPPRHDGIAAATLYTEPSRKLVLSLKHGRRIALAPVMARLIAARLDRVGPDWIVVPVPLHRWRLWQRGFNQAAEIGRALARLRGVQLVVTGLERRKATPSLGGLGKKARKRALVGAISVPDRMRPRIKGARVVLVDDVLTSGATSNACVSALKRAGASEVVIACFARVID